MQKHEVELTPKVRSWIDADKLMCYRYWEHYRCNRHTYIVRLHHMEGFMAV